MQTTSPATANRLLHLLHLHPESWPLLHRRKNHLLPHHAYRVPTSLSSPRYMILRGKGKAILFSGRAIGSRSSKRLEAQMIGGRASCVVSEAAFLRITVNRKTDSDTGEIEMGGNCFSDRSWQKGAPRLYNVWDCSKWKTAIGITKRALRYALGVY